MHAHSSWLAPAYDNMSMHNLKSICSLSSLLSLTAWSQRRPRKPYTSSIAAGFSNSLSTYMLVKSQRMHRGEQLNLLPIYKCSCSNPSAVCVWRPSGCFPDSCLLHMYLKRQHRRMSSLQHCSSSRQTFKTLAALFHMDGPMAALRRVSPHGGPL